MEPQAGTTLLNVELTPAVPIVIPFVAALPSDALGDEDGFIEVRATLTSDPSVETVAWIAIEALRTRGLTLVGPTGLASSQGYGIPGYNAEAYVLIENLGNAVKRPPPSIGRIHHGEEHLYCSMAPAMCIQLRSSLVKRRNYKSTLTFHHQRPLVL